MIDRYSLQVILPSADVSRWSPVSTYGKNGLTYVYGKPDKVFRLRFSNHTAARVLAVPTIDGLSTIDGKPCDSARSPGYVVAAYSSIEIKGWSISNDESAQFVFKDKKGSYVANSASMEGEANCGVIGCLVFAEERPPQPVFVTQTFYQRHPFVRWVDPCPTFPIPPWDTWPTCGTVTCGSSGGVVVRSVTSSELNGTIVSNSLSQGCSNNSLGNAGNVANTSACYMSSLAGEAVQSVGNTTDAPNFVLGTGWGDNQADRTSSVEFKRGSLLEAITLYYTSLEKLVEAGIEVDKSRKTKVSMPQAFGGFCVPPIKK